MSFNPSIPEISNFLAVSQKQMLANYQAIYNAFVQNHIALAQANQGQHNSLTLRAQTIDPTTASNQAALYNKLDGGGIPQLFFRPSNDQTPIQMTNSNLNTTNGGNQASYFAGPFTFYIGYRLGIANNTPVVCTPASTLIYAGASCLVSTNNDVPIATSLSTNQFILRYSHVTIPSINIYYFAIGLT